MTADEALAAVENGWRSDDEGELPYVLAAEVRRLREVIASNGADALGKIEKWAARVVACEAVIDRVEAYMTDDRNWRTASAYDDGHHPLLDSTREELRELLRGER